MEWLSDNWIIVALFGGMAAWHLLGRKHGAGHGGCCGGAHGHPGHGQGEKKPDAESDASG